jgi:hypothetical protein
VGGGGENLSPLFLGPESIPDLGGGFSHWEILLQDVSHGSGQLRGLPKAAHDGVACGGVHQVGGGPKGGDRLAVDGQRPTHRDVGPFLLDYPLHLHILRGSRYV